MLNDVYDIQVASNVKGRVSSSFMEHFISRQTTTNLWVFSTSGTGNALNYINLMHQIRRIITLAQLHVCRRVLLDVRGIVRFRGICSIARIKVSFVIAKLYNFTCKSDNSQCRK